MSPDRHEDAYSAAKVKRSLLHFLVGKTASALVAVGMLLLLVRMLPREQYGLYIVLLATLELIQLGSSLGCYPALSRYVPELRARGQGLALRRLVLQLSAWRGITLALACVAVALGGSALAALLGFPSYASIVALYSIVIFFEGAARYTDVLFETLLMQGASQSAVLLRNGLRLLGIVAFWQLDGALSMLSLVWLEAGASAAGLFYALMLAWRHVNLISRLHPGSPQAPGVARMRAYAWPAYLAQLLGLAQGPDLVKMLVARLAGAVLAGAFGFAAAMASMLQRYLPVFLLIGMVRPLFVSRHARGQDGARLVELANLVFKLNVFVLAPAAVLLAVIGEQVAGILSGGKFPDAGPYLFGFVALLVMQTLHTVLGLIALAVEESRAGLLGTVWGLVGIAAGLAGFMLVGPLALCAGLIVSELMWCQVMQRALRRHGCDFKIDWTGFVRLWLLSIAAAVPLYWISRGSADVSHLLAGTALMMLLYLVLARLWRPFSFAERHLINSALPKPLFIW